MRFVPPSGVRDLGSVGTCIYCGATDGLEDEHPVPFSLGGTLLLRDASCRRCAGKTSRWERLISHESFLPFRTILGLPTYRPKSRPTSFPARVKVGGEWRDDSLALERVTAVAPFPKLAPPGVLEGRPPSPEFRAGAVGLTVIRNDGGETHPARRAGVEALETAVPFNPAAFMRMLAKIGWCFTVATYGPDAVRPEVLGLILGEDDNVAHWVGGMEDGMTLFHKPAESPIHVCVGVTPDGWVRSGIRLWSDQGVPEYQVVVGRALRPLP
jgi:hypothetical protein